MEYGVHIITLGRTPESALAAIQHFGRKDKIWIISSRDNETVDGKEIRYLDIENDVIGRFMTVNIRNIETWVIEDPFDYQEVYDAVVRIARMERGNHSDCRFYINFTSGTPIMTGAVCSAANTIGADLYYVRNAGHDPDGRDAVIEIETDRLREVSLLNRRKRTRSIFETIGSRDTITHSELMEASDIKNNALTPHTTMLQRNNLIVNMGSSKFPVWRLTERGRDVLNRLD